MPLFAIVLVTSIGQASDQELQCRHALRDQEQRITRTVQDGYTVTVRRKADPALTKDACVVEVRGPSGQVVFTRDGYNTRLHADIGRDVDNDGTPDLIIGHDTHGDTRCCWEYTILSLRPAPHVAGAFSNPSFEVDVNRRTAVSLPGSPFKRRTIMASRDRLSDSGVSRRDMMRLGAGGLGFGLFGGIGPVPYVLSQASQAAASTQSGKILVVFEWFGGNDGLNTIVPYGDPMYYKHRPTIGIKEKDLLKIDAHLGWHKSMGGMKRLYDEGKVAIVQGVGYDQPSFSHFSSVSFWHTAAPNSGNEYGWIGRTASALDPDGARQNMIVNISNSQTLAVRAEKHVPLVFSDPTRFQRDVFAQEKNALDTLSAQRAPVGDAHSYVLEVTRSAAQASELVRAAWSRYNGKDNPDLRLLDLDKVVALIEADFPTKLYYVPLRNSLFDTHVNQAAPHDRQLQYCSDAIAGFFQEMKRIGRADDVVMYVHSEFGRRVPENTSLGTDHGTAQVNFVIGDAVKGGLYGKPPSLTNLVLGDNLESTTDFRQVYTSLIQEWMGADAAKVLGRKFTSMGMFRA